MVPVPTSEYDLRVGLQFFLYERAGSDNALGAAFFGRLLQRFRCDDGERVGAGGLKEAR